MTVPCLEKARATVSWHRVAPWGTGVLALCLSASGCGEETSLPAGVVARVGEVSITLAAAEAAAARLGDGEQSWASMSRTERQELLDAMIAADLLVLEARERGLEEDGQVAFETRRLERRLLADELYRQQVEAGPEVTEQELQELYLEWDSGKEMQISHIQSRTREEAMEALVQLNSGADFEQLARERSRHTPSAVQGGHMGYVRRRQILPEFLPAVDELSPGQVYQRPIETSLGYHIVKLSGRRQRPLEQMRKALEMGVVRRERHRRREALQQRLEEEYRLQWHPAVALELARSREDSMVSGAALLYSWSGGGLATVDLTLRVDGAGAEAIRDTSRLHAIAHRMALEDLAALEARRLGLHEAEAIRTAVEARHKRLLGERLFELEVASKEMEDSERRRFFEDHRDSYRDITHITIREILVADAALADSLYDLVKAGQDMASLARRHTLRAELRDSGGLWEGLRPDNPQGAKLYGAAIEADGLQPPLKVVGGYSVFDVLEKQPGRALAYDEVVDAVRKDLATSRMDDFIGELRARYASQILVDEALLSSRSSDSE